MAETENCFNCVYSYWDPTQIPWSLSGGQPLRPACANHPDSPGRLRPLSSGRICRNYRPRTAAPEGDVKQIPVGEGLFAYVDAADFEWLNQWTWHLANGYPARFSHGKVILMHRQIMQPPEGMVVDHLNHNKLDNTRANLRKCTQRENVYNSAKRRGTTSRFRGVLRRKERNNWYARIWVEGRRIWLGSFAEEIEAARAHDRGAVEHFGESARLNFPEEWPPERRQQTYSQQAAANRSVGATHASGSQTQTSAFGDPSPSPGKGKTATGGRPKTEDRGRREGGAKKEGKKVETKEGKTRKAKRKTPAAEPRATNRPVGATHASPSAGKRKTGGTKRAKQVTRKTQDARRQTKSPRATGHGPRATTKNAKDADRKARGRKKKEKAARQMRPTRPRTEAQRA